MVASFDRHRSPRVGSLYLELLVVIFLVGTLLAVLVPQFVRSRTVARRTQCLNNLKNISLALQSYSDTHETFPPGYIVRNVTAASPAGEEKGPGWGWATMILPQMEQQALYRAFDFKQDLPPVTTMISPLLCPDDRAAPFTVTSDLYGLVSLAPSSYVGVAGFGSLTDTPGRPLKPGMFYRNSWVTPEDVTDGISNTFLIGERRSIAEMADGRLIETCSAWAGAVSGAFREPGYPDVPRLEGPGSLVLGIMGQAGAVPLKIPPNGAPQGLGFSSGHENGAHFSRADGSCKLISNQIDLDLYMRLGQRADNEPTNEP